MGRFGSMQQCLQAVLHSASLKWKGTAMGTAAQLFWCLDMMHKHRLKPWVFISVKHPGVQVMMPSESRRPGAKPVPKNGLKWPHVTLHAAPSEAQVAELSGSESVHVAGLNVAIKQALRGIQGVQHFPLFSWMDLLVQLDHFDMPFRCFL